MENDQTSMTPVEASNQSAALPGSAGSPGPAAASGGASAAYGGASTAAPAATAPSPVTEPYATMTTPTAVNVPNPRAKPFHGPTPRIREDVVTSPAFGARGASEIQWTAQSRLDQNQEQAIRTEAGRLGIAPSTLASVIAYETIGTFSTDIKGGKGGNYYGLIQFGPNERRTYGYREGMTFEEQLAGPVHAYLVDRGLKPGMGIAEVYSIINAGSLKNGQPRWGASDRPGWNVRRHAEEITNTRLPEFQYLDEGWSPPRQEVDIPNPRPRPSDAADPALGAAGARSMPETIPGSPSAAYGPLAAAEPGPAMPTLAGIINTDGDLLVRGAKGDATREWQTFLSENGYTDARGRPLAIDGDFGRRTREATKQFQIASQIEADGIVGPETLSAALYVVDPTSSPMPGQVAYVDGANAAQKIIDPTAPEVAIPLPRPRPERGAGIPNPPANPRRAGEPEPAQWSDVDEMTMVDESGNYINPAPQPPAKIETEADIQQSIDAFRANAIRNGAPEGPALDTAVRGYEEELRKQSGIKAPARVLYGPADVGRMTSNYRDGLIAAGNSPETVDEATRAFERAFKASGQFRYANGLTPAEVGRMTSDFRERLISEGMSGPALDMAVTTYENAAKTDAGRAQRVSDAQAAARGATRQRLSGTGLRIDRFRPRDAYRAIEAERVRQTEAVREFARGIADTYLKVRDRSRTAPMATPDPERQPFINDALMRAAPTPAETVIEAYAFRRRA